MILLSVSQIEANAFFHCVLHESRQDDNYFTYTGSFKFLYSLLLVKDYFTDNSAREKLTLLIRPVKSNYAVAC